MNLFLGIIVGLLVLNLIVIVHEFGHYLMARKNGVVVEEFGIGFPPKAWSKKLKNGVILSINWLPIGGFCRMQGENDSASHKGDYGRASFKQKTAILFGGVVFNWVLAALLFTGLALVGLPKAVDNQFSIKSDVYEYYEPVVVATVVEDSPAAKAGLQKGDELLKIGEYDINKSSEVTDSSRIQAGKTVTVEYKRDGKTATVETTLNAENSGKGYLGVQTPQNLGYIRATWSAPIVGVVSTFQLTAETFKGLGQMVGNFFSGVAKQLNSDEQVRQEGQQSISEAGNGLAGPVGIIGMILPQAFASGPVILAFVAAIISLSLAVMNILPIPALDGGRWLLTVIFKLRKKELAKETEEKVVSISFMVLLCLVVLTIILDVTRFF